MSMNENYIEIKDLVKRYGEEVAVNIPRLNIAKGDIYSLIGESGCGKSTLSRLLLQIEKQTSGKIYFRGDDIAELVKKDAKKFRKDCMYLFQNPFSIFDPSKKVLNSIISIMKLHKIGKNNEERRQICCKILTKVGLDSSKEIFKKYPSEFSGGQLQRLSLMYMLILKPQFIVADEPTSMLDLSLRSEIIHLLLDNLKEVSGTLLFISHDLDIVFQISDKIAVMYKGRIVEYGLAEEIKKNAVHPYSRLLIDNYSLQNQDIASKNLIHSNEEVSTGCLFAPFCQKAKQECFIKVPEAAWLSDKHVVYCAMANCSEQ